MLPPPLLRRRGRDPGGRLVERHEPRVCLSPAPVGAFRSFSLSPEEEGNPPTFSAPRLLSKVGSLNHQQDFKRLSKYLDYFLRIDCQKWSDWVTGM